MRWSRSKVVVITGASAGVGRAAAREFARRGANVGLLARNSEALENAATEARQLGVRAMPVPVDVADATAVDTAADRIESLLGPIDVWVNNAMVTVVSPISRLDAEEIRRVTEVTYLGTVHGTLAALRRCDRAIGEASCRSAPLWPIGPFHCKPHTARRSSQFAASLTR